MKALNCVMFKVNEITGFCLTALTDRQIDRQTHRQRDGSGGRRFVISVLLVVTVAKFELIELYSSLQVHELQRTTRKIVLKQLRLSQIISAGSRKRNWFTVEFIHTSSKSDSQERCFLRFSL